jgi:hypothetical protein
MFHITLLCCRFGNYDDAAKIAAERSKDPDMPDTTDMEALPSAGHGRRVAERELKDKKRRKREMEEQQDDEDARDSDAEAGPSKTSKQSKVGPIAKPKHQEKNKGM